MNTINKTTDRILELQAQDQLLKFYVPVSPGQNEYFTSEQLAIEFATLIGSTIKPL